MAVVGSTVEGIAIVVLACGSNSTALDRRESNHSQRS